MLHYENQQIICLRKSDYQNTLTSPTHTHRPLAIWVKLEAVDGSKVTFDPSNLLLEHQVVEPSVKLPCLCVRGSDLHRLLTSSQHNLRKGQT